MGFSRYLWVKMCPDDEYCINCINYPLLCLQMIKQLQQRMTELKKTLQKELVRVMFFQSLQLVLTDSYMHY